MFIAVSNSPAMTQGIIRFLSESMPGTEIHTVALEEQTTDPLQAVLAQLPSEDGGPVMIVGLEKAVRSDQPEHSVLFNLNLSRPEWPRKMPRPVVLWVPEYVLALLGREAPDFLDWRSDTVCFLEQPNLMHANPELWMDALWARMPEPLRRERIEELRSRISNWSDKVDPLTYSEWLRELGDHCSVLSDFGEAEHHYLAALAIAKAVGESQFLSLLYHRLNALYKTQGRDSEAAEYLQRFLETVRDLGLSELEGDAFTKLLNALRDPSQDELTEEKLRLFLDYFRRTGSWEGASSALYTLGFLLFRRGRVTEAEHMLLEAIEIEERWGKSSSMGEHLRLLGDIYMGRGDLERAEAVLMRSLSIGKELGDRIAVASSYLDLGRLFKLQGNSGEAADALRQAQTIFSEIGASPMRELAEQQLRELVAPASPSERPEDTNPRPAVTTEPR